MIKKIVFILVLGIIFFSLFSCADSLPSISEVKKTLVYDFQYENRPPTQRLVLFLNIASDERRIQRFELIEKEKKFHWYIDSLEEVKIANKKYFGTSEIMMPETLIFTNAQYELCYYDLADRMASKNFTLSIPQSIRNRSLDEIELESIKNKDYGQEFSSHEIVIYDILKNPLYAGKMTTVLESKDSLKNEFPQSFSYREYFRNPDYSAVIFCPEIFLDEHDFINSSFE